MKKKLLTFSKLESPLGPLVAVGDEEHLYLLEFEDQKGLDKQLFSLEKKLSSPLLTGKTPAIQSIQKELIHYFERGLERFSTPFLCIGTPFQKSVWSALNCIPFGKTLSYSEVATIIGKPTAFRAVAQAIGSNPLAIVVPCHRVIRSTGELGGYAGGLHRKTWLLDHERC